MMTDGDIAAAATADRLLGVRLGVLACGQHQGWARACVSRAKKRATWLAVCNRSRPILAVAATIHSPRQRDQQ